MNGVVVSFPWGAGGNLVKNIITLDTRFDFFDDSEFLKEYPDIDQRYEWMLNYYQQSMTPNTWLKREWSIRTRFHNRYYEGGNPVYWNPNFLTAYDCHGGSSTSDNTECENILSNRHMSHYDRFRVDRKLIHDQLSDWTLKDCDHIFIIPDSALDIAIISEIYNSKNPTINQLQQIEDIDDRRRASMKSIITQTQSLVELKRQLEADNCLVHAYTTAQLLNDTGYRVLENIIDRLKLNIPVNYVQTLQQIWLQSTREVYYNYFNRNLTI